MVQYRVLTLVLAHSIKFLSVSAVSTMKTSSEEIAICVAGGVQSECSACVSADNGLHNGTSSASAEFRKSKNT